MPEPKNLNSNTSLFLKTELSFFAKNKDEYLKHYENMYVLVKGEKFFGAYTSASDAYTAGVKEFGNVSFLIRQVLKDNQQNNYINLAYFNGLTNANNQ